MKKFPKNVKITDYLRKKAHFCRYFQFFCKRRREKKSAGFKQAEKGCRFCPVFFSLYFGNFQTLSGKQSCFACSMKCYKSGKNVK